MSASKRLGAGRPKGSLGKRTRELAERVAQCHDLTPIDVMLKIMIEHYNEARRLDDPKAKTDAYEVALKAAASAAPYIHPRLAAVLHQDASDKGIIVEVMKFATNPAAS